MTVPDPSNPMLDAALAFHAAGCSVVPAMGNGSKRPLGTWQKFQRDRADLEQIHVWFDNGHPGIGLVCGAVSGGLVMLEAEGRAIGENLLARAREHAMAAGIGELWRTVMAGYLEQTPGGGVHILYRLSDGQVPGNQKLARRPNPAGGVDVLAETRGEGGFTITAPSHGPTHPSGRPWLLLQGGPATIPTLTLAEHTALCSVFRALDEMPTEEERWTSSTTAATGTAGTGSGTTPPSPLRAGSAATAQPGEPSPELTPGNDFNARADWAGILTPHGWRQVGQRGPITDWLRPGKADPNAISATTGYGGDRGDFLYVFSTSTALNSERAYSKFAAWAALNHGGDYSAAARELRRQGYGGQGGTGTAGSVFDLLPPQPAPETPWQPAASQPSPSTLSDATQHPPDATSSPSTDGSTAASSSTGAAGAEPGSDAEPHTSWWPRDLTDLIAGRGNTQSEPAILARADGHRILYAGKVNGLVGESESGKSWLALLAVKQVLEVGGAVLFFDFEDTADAIVERLRVLDVTDSQLAGFHYIAPEEALHDPAQLDLRTTLATVSPVLIVVDGFNAAMTLLGLSLLDNTDITTFFLTFLRPLRANDACVLTIDHVTKSKEGRGDHAIGGQAKKAMTDGSYIGVENIQPFGRNQSGRLKLTSIKDRPGHVRAISGSAKHIGTVEVTSTNDKVKLRITPPDMRPREERGPFRPTGLMEKVSRLLEAMADDSGVSGAAIERQIDAKREHVRAACARLVEDHYVALRPGPRGAVMHHSTRPYRNEEHDPASLIAPAEEASA